MTHAPGVSADARACVCVQSEPISGQGTADTRHLTSSSPGALFPSPPLSARSTWQTSSKHNTASTSSGLHAAAGLSASDALPLPMGAHLVMQPYLNSAFALQHEPSSPQAGDWMQEAWPNMDTQQAWRSPGGRQHGMSREDSPLRHRVGEYAPCPLHLCPLLRPPVCV